MRCNASDVRALPQTVPERALWSDLARYGGRAEAPLNDGTQARLPRTFEGVSECGE